MCRLLPDLALTVVHAKRLEVRLEILRVYLLEGSSKSRVEKLPMRRQDFLANDLAYPIVSEVETLAVDVKDTATHQFLDGLGGLSIPEPRRPLKKIEIELSPDHAREGNQLTTAVAQPVEAPQNDVPNPSGERGRRVRRSTLERVHSLHDHQGVPFTGLPELPTELSEGGRPQTGSRKGRDEDHRFSLRERPERHVLVIQVLEHPAERRRVDEFLLADGCEDEHGPALNPASRVGEEPDAHVVGQMHILQDQDKRARGGEVGEEMHDGLEEVPLVWPDGLWRGGTELGHQSSELGAPHALEAVERRGVFDMARAEGLHPRPERKDLLALV